MSQLLPIVEVLREIMRNCGQRSLSVGAYFTL